jgi:hypothetical protein
MSYVGEYDLDLMYAEQYSAPRGSIIFCDLVMSRHELGQAPQVINMVAQKLPFTKEQRWLTAQGGVPWTKTNLSQLCCSQ